MNVVSVLILLPRVLYNIDPFTALPPYPVLASLIFLNLPILIHLPFKYFLREPEISSSGSRMRVNTLYRLVVYPMSKYLTINASLVAAEVTATPQGFSVVPA